MKAMVFRSMMTSGQTVASLDPDATKVSVECGRRGPEAIQSFNLFKVFTKNLYRTLYF